MDLTLRRSNKHFFCFVGTVGMKVFPCMFCRLVAYYAPGVDFLYWELSRRKVCTGLMSLSVSRMRWCGTPVSMNWHDAVMGSGFEVGDYGVGMGLGVVFEGLKGGGFDLLVSWMELNANTTSNEREVMNNLGLHRLSLSWSFTHLNSCLLGDGCMNS